MRKLSYGFSGQERAGRAAKRGIPAVLLLITVLLGALSGAPLPARAEEQVAVPQPPAPEPSGRVFELHRVQEPVAKGAPEQGNASKIQVGDQIILELDEAEAASFAVKPPAADAAGPLRDAGWEVLPGQKPGQIIAIALKPGTATLPPLPVHPAQPADSAAAGSTAEFSAVVVSAIAPDDPKPQEPAALRPPARVQLPLWVWIAAALAALAILAGAVWALVRLSRKSQAAAPAAPPKPALPEDVAALEALNAIAAADWISKGVFKPHYFGISDVLKTYFEARYGFDARECTSAELLRGLEEKSGAGDSLIDRVDALFQKLDLVKFTDHVPAISEGASLLEEARAVVRQTRRLPPVVPAATEGGKG